MGRWFFCREPYVFDVFYGGNGRQEFEVLFDGGDEDEITGLAYSFPCSTNDFLVLSTISLVSVVL